MLLRRRKPLLYIIGFVVLLYAVLSLVFSMGLPSIIRSDAPLRPKQDRSFPYLVTPLDVNDNRIFSLGPSVRAPFSIARDPVTCCTTSR
jgi:hypothetical protein